jgi:hypothetical protein
MAELTTKGRGKLRSSQFAYVDSNGGEHLPIHDESHVRNAIARFSQTDFMPRSAPGARSGPRRGATASRSTASRTPGGRAGRTRLHPRAAPPSTPRQRTPRQRSNAPLASSRLT